MNRSLTKQLFKLLILLALLIEGGYNAGAQTFTVKDTTQCGDVTGAIFVSGFDSTKHYEYLLIPRSLFSKPIITLLGDNPVHISVSSTYTDAGATAYDSQFGDISANILTVNNVNTATAGTYTVTYNVSNPNGIAADEVERTVLVEEDNHYLSVVSGTGSGTYSQDELIEIVADAPEEGFEFAGWTGDAQYIDDPTNSTAHVTMPNADVNVEATYREISGGSPIITILGDNPLTWILGETFVDPGATAYDEKDGDITSSIIASNNVNTNMAGTYYVTYNVVDNDGHAAEEVVRTVNVGSGFTITTTKQTSFTIAIACTTYNIITIHWGDGETTLVSGGGNQVHSYAESGEHTIAFSGDLSVITNIISATQEITSINLSPDLTELQTLNIPGNLFPSLVVPETCVDLALIYVYTNTNLTTLITDYTYSNWTTNWQLRAYGTNISSIKVPYGVTNLYYFWAYSNTSLVEVDLRGAVASLNTIDLHGCTSLTTFTANYLTTATIGINLTYTAIAVINIPELTNATGSLSFYNTPALTTVNLPKLVSCERLSMPYNASLTTINVQMLETVTGSLSLNNLTSISSIDLPSLVSVGGIITFASSSFTGITIPALTTVGQINCSVMPNVTSILLPELLYVTSSSGVCDFNGSPNLTTFSAPKLIYCPRLVLATTANALSSVTLTALSEVKDGNLTIQQTQLTSLSMPALTSITNGYFNVNTNSLLTSISTPNLGYVKLGFYVYSQPNLTTLTYSSIISGITSFSAYNTGLTSITIPNTSTTLTSFYAYLCPNLTSISLPSTVGELNALHCYSCPNLTSIVLPTTTGTVNSASWRFEITGLAYIDLPATITNYNTLRVNSCPNLWYLHVNGSVTTLNGFYFQLTPSLVDFSIPSTITSMSVVSGFGSGISSFPIPSAVTNIVTVQMYDTPNLTSFSLPPGNTNCSTFNLYNSGVTSISIPQLKPAFGGLNIHNNVNLTSLTMPDNLTSLTSITAVGNTSLTNFTLPTGITSLSTLSLSGNTALATINYSGVVSIMDLHLGSIPNTAISNIPLTSITHIYMQNNGFGAIDCETVLYNMDGLSNSVPSCTLYFFTGNTYYAALTQNGKDLVDAIRAKGWTISN